MPDSVFERQTAHVSGNQQLRRPQRESYEAIDEHFKGNAAENEVGIVLPVGCGKSGTITITPFATRATKVLVIAPGLRIAGPSPRACVLSA